MVSGVRMYINDYIYKPGTDNEMSALSTSSRYGIFGFRGTFLLTLHERSSHTQPHREQRSLLSPISITSCQLQSIITIITLAEPNLCLPRHVRRLDHRLHHRS